MSVVKNPLHPGTLDINRGQETLAISDCSFKPSLSRELRWYHLICLGVGATIGAGIFVVTGVVARDKTGEQELTILRIAIFKPTHVITGPALFLSYIFSGIACLLSAFSYAEFASISPTAGSAYGYARSTLGEFAGWVIGWDLILEYGVSSAAVAQACADKCTQLHYII